MWGDGYGEQAPSSTIKGNCQQLTIHPTSRPKTFAGSTSSPPLPARVLLKVVDVLEAAEGGHHTSQWPFLAIVSIVIMGSQKSLVKNVP